MDNRGILIAGYNPQCIPDRVEQPKRFRATHTLHVQHNYIYLHFLHAMDTLGVCPICTYIQSIDTLEVYLICTYIQSIGTLDVYPICTYTLDVYPICTYIQSIDTHLMYVPYVLTYNPSIHLMCIPYVITCNQLIHT
jgi:hypothetical protein